MQKLNLGEASNNIHFFACCLTSAKTTWESSSGFDEHSLMLKGTEGQAHGEKTYAAGVD